MKINNIKQVSTSKYSVVIDDQKYTLYDDVLIEFNILKAKEIDDQVFDHLIYKNNYYDAYHKIINYISFKLRTEKEIKDKLYSYKIDKEIILEILNKLKEEKLIDNQKYIISYINDQINLTLNGPKKIEYNLIKLGFKKEDFINYIDSYDESIWIKRCNKLIEKKQKESIKSSYKNTIQKYKVYLNNMGYKESYYSSNLLNLSFDDLDALKRDYLKLYIKYSKKVDNTQLDYLIKQKLYAKGYSLAKIEKIKTDFN